MLPSKGEEDEVLVGEYRLTRSEWNAFDLMMRLGRLRKYQSLWIPVLYEFHAVVARDERIDDSIILSLQEKGLVKLLRNNEAAITKPLYLPQPQNPQAVVARVEDIVVKEEWHCIRCGSLLNEVASDDPSWGGFCSDYKERDGTTWFLCSKTECAFSNTPLVLCHPVYGWTRKSGDSFAIAFVK